MIRLHPHWLAMFCGVIPALATHAAFALNLAAPGHELAAGYHCLPYWDGCVSISRAVRSGPGLLVFRALMLPTAALLALTWLLTGQWLALLRPHRRRQARGIAAVGMIGAAFLVLYVGWLGTEGTVYGWLRRYGVTFYFGLTALAQLVLVHALWPLRNPRRAPVPAATGANLRNGVLALLILVSVQWFGGVASVAKRMVLTQAGLIDRIENVIEWWFALALSAAFVALAYLMRRTGYRLNGRLGVDPD